MRKVITGAGAFLLSAGIILSGSGAALADGVHLMPTGEATVWRKGCTATYSLDARASADYAATVAKSLSYITPYTGITFVRVGDSDPNANIRYSVVDDLSQYGTNVAGIGSTDGSVQLLPATKLPLLDGLNSTQRNFLRTNLVTHETLHVLGLGHDDDGGSPNPDEIMHPILPIDSSSFGAGDKAGMEYIRAANNCTPPTGVPLELEVPVPPAGSVPTWKPFASKTVKALIPTKSAYYATTSYRTVVASSKPRKVIAKSDGKSVWVKTTSGWSKVPYIYKPRTNTLVYSEALKIQQGIDRDVLGGVAPRIIG